MESRSRAIDKVYKRRDRIEMPDFQREEVWPDKKKRLLIDSVLKGWHLPKFYFRKLDDGTFECVDGQQRLSAIFDFFDDRLRLSDDRANRMGAIRYSDLSDDLSDSFDDYEIDIEEIEDATEEELEELFKRLQLGTPLNTAEKINAISGDLRDFCHKAAESGFFSSKIGLRNTRYTHFEIVAKWGFIEARGIQPQMRFPQLESFLKDNRSFDSQSGTGKRISAALAFLIKAFPDSCRYIRNRANTLSVCMLASRLVDQDMTGTNDAREFGKFGEDFFQRLSAEVEKGVKAVDKELLRYQHAITSGSTGGDSVEARITILTKRLAAFAPRFSSLLGSYREAADEVVRNLADLAQGARDLVYDANRKYAARHGEDLFKMTTETSSALADIATPSRDVAGYGKLIDALYFLVYEGTGACKRLSTPPPSFPMDIKFLRTEERHDVDHGNAADVKKKKLRAGDVFERYSGKRAPQECGPDEFLGMQIRILNGLIGFLRALP